MASKCSAEIIQIVIERWGKEPSEQILADVQAHRPGMSMNSLRRLVFFLRKSNPDLGRYVKNKSWKRWTAEDEAFVRSNAGVHSVDDMAKALGRTKHSIIQFAKRDKISLLVQ